MCIVHYTILSVIFCHCVQFAHCLLCVRILHLWTLWILTFLPSHHTISNFLLYDLRLCHSENAKCLHSCTVPIMSFFFITSLQPPMESCDILDQFSAALFASAVLLKHFQFQNTSSIQ